MLIAQREVAVLRANYDDFESLSAVDRLKAKTLPLLFERNQIWLEATAEEKRGYFMLDTGAPTLLLADDGDIVTKTAITGQGMYGDVELRPHSVASFRIGGERQGAQSAYLLDLKHFESRSGNKLLGMIGYEQLKDFEIYFDLKHHRLEFMPANRNELHKVRKAAHTFTFEYDEHLPVIVLTNGKQELRLAIDTGAGVNMINTAIVESMENLQDLKDTVNVAGLGGRNMRMNYYKIGKLKMGSIDLSNATFITADLNHLQLNNKRIDGIIGLDLLKQFKFSINFKKQRLYIW